MDALQKLLDSVGPDGGVVVEKAPSGAYYIVSTVQRIVGGIGVVHSDRLVEVYFAQGRHSVLELALTDAVANIKPTLPTSQIFTDESGRKWKCTLVEED